MTRNNSFTSSYLAHGDSIQKNAWFYAIGSSTIHAIIPEVCQIICRILGPRFLSFPTEDEFLMIANDFLELLHIPNCVGALDGRHCAIRKPPHSGSLFYNYKKFHSIVLMAISDAHKRFIWANVGDYGEYISFLSLRIGFES